MSSDFTMTLGPGFFTNRVIQSRLGAFPFAGIALLASMLSVTSSPALAQQTRALPVLVDGSAILDTDDVRPVIVDLTQSQLDALSQDQTQLRNAAIRAYRDKQMVAEAERVGLVDDPSVAARLEAARRQVLTNALREHIVASFDLPDFSKLAEERYRAEATEFERPEAFRIAQILRKVDCGCEEAAQAAEIEAAQEALSAGADFSEVARRMSQDSSALDGGEIPGWLTRAQLAPELAEAVAGLGDREVSDPIRTPAGLHLVKRLAYRPAARQSFDEVKSQLESAIKKEYIRDQLTDVLSEYFPAADAEFDLKAMRALVDSLKTEESSTQ